MSTPIPRGIEVLVKKASVDPAFRTVLFQRRAAAAAGIGLELSAGEIAMLAAVSEEQLDRIIAQVTVPQEHRRAFLGQAAAAMLAALGMVSSADAGTGGRVPLSGFGISPDSPPSKPSQPRARKPMETEEIEKKVIELASKQFKTEASEITRDTEFVKDLGANAAGLAKLKKSLEKQFNIKISYTAFKKLNAVGDVVSHVETALQPKESSKPTKTQPEFGSGGIRPDRPPAGGLGGMRPGP